MNSKLIIKNFGPIKKVELDLNNVNVFIGHQASGKSAIAKLFTIFKSPRSFCYQDYETKTVEGDYPENEAYDSFVSVLKDYNIYSFLKIDTEILFESELHRLEYKQVKIKYTPKLLNSITELRSLSINFENNKSVILNKLKPILKKHVYFLIRTEFLFFPATKNPKGIVEFEAVISKITQDSIHAVLDIIQGIEKELSDNAAIYIPAERSFSNLIKKSALNLMKANVQIPRHLLNFGAYLESVSPTDVNLDFIQSGLKYVHIDGEEKIFIDSSQSIFLSESASGIQSVIPIIDAVFHGQKTIRHSSYVIEEPELNLFPLAQYGLIQLLEENRKDPIWEDAGTIHTYTTHSPYILSCLNNLLYASKVSDIIASKELGTFSYDRYIEALVQVKKITKAIIKPSSFSAYQINNGEAVSIFDKQTGLIGDNFIDEASDEIDDDFDKLMNLINGG